MFINFKKSKFPRYLVKGVNMCIGADNVNNVILAMKLLCDNDCPSEYVEFFETKRNKLGFVVLIPITLSKIADQEERERVKFGKITTEIIEEPLDDGFNETESFDLAEKQKVAEKEPAEVNSPAPQKTALKIKAEKLKEEKKNKEQNQNENIN